MQTSQHASDERPFATTANVLADVLYDLAGKQHSPDIINTAKSRLIDAISVSINAKSYTPSLVARNSVSRTVGSSTVLMDGSVVGMQEAAFLNGVTGCTSLQEDATSGRGGHSGTYVVPAVLAVAEELRSSGQEVLNAIVVGYECAGLVASAVTRHLRERGFREVAFVGPIAAAAAASALFGLDRSQMANALALSTNFSGGTYEGFRAGTIEAYLHAGCAARNGILAAQLAQAGAEAAPLSFEGKNGFFSTYAGNAECHVDYSNSTLAITAARRKFFPACDLNQHTMLMLGSMQANFNAADIDRVTLRRPSGKVANGVWVPGNDCEPPFNMLQAQMSVKFTTVAALLGRPITSLAYFRDHCNDAEVVDIVKRTTLVVEDDIDPSVQIHFLNGDSITICADDIPNWQLLVKSSTNTTLSAMLGKFDEIAAPTLGEKSDLIKVKLVELEAVLDIRELMSLFQ